MRTNYDKVFGRAKSLKGDEDGSITIFSLIIFVLILMMAGTAVDMMRYERERTGLQNAMDAGVIAASSLNQGADPTDLVKDYVAKAGYDPDLVTVTPQVSTLGGVVNGRSVTATAEFQMGTYFMKMMGFDQLPGQASGTALEGSQVLEIVLVLDISGSMGWDAASGGTKMEVLKSAAKEFVTLILDNNEPERVSFSIVPYNQQVYMDAPLMARLSLANDTFEVVDPLDHPGAITVYQTRNTEAPCARFHSADFDTRRLAAAAEIDTSAGFSTNNNNSYNTMGEGAFWCGDSYPKMMLYQNDETTLHTHIDSLTTQGWTAVDYGMNWGVGILDPSFEPVVADMVADGEAPASAQDHPVAYTNGEVKKFIILMTDGTNTLQQDLAQEMKAGPSRVWHSETLANGNNFDGYLFEMPDNDANQRWFVPGDPDTNADNSFLAEGALPEDAQQWSKHQLFRRFSVKNIAEYFYQTTEDDFEDDYLIEGGYGAADDNLRAICDEVKTAGGIEVYTVAFEAPQNSQTLLDYCKTEDGKYFDVDGTQLSEAFRAIAIQISLLRLTE